jgi:hypothetical protein
VVFEARLRAEDEEGRDSEGRDRIPDSAVTRIGGNTAGFKLDVGFVTYFCLVIIARSGGSWIV